MEPAIYVVEDDEPLRKVLASAGNLLGHPVYSFASAEEFLGAYRPEGPGCLVLDIKLGGMSGLKLQSQLSEQGTPLPIIMISGHADVRIAVEAMSMGALTLLEKPFRLEELLSHLEKGLERGIAEWVALQEHSGQEARMARLTPKEREVLAMIADGKANKEMAELLGLSVRAVEDRRARLMKKVGARSILDLARILSGGPPA